MTSVRLFIGGWCEGRDVLVKRIAETLRGIKIEPDSRHNGHLFLELTITPHANLGTTKSEGEKGTNVPKIDNLIDDKFTPISQVYKEFDVSHFPSQGSDVLLSKDNPNRESTS